MLLQGHESLVRLFPSWPRKCDVHFTRLRTYGAFLFSSAIEQEQIPWVKVFSEQGGICRMQNPWPGASVRISNHGQVISIARSGVLQWQTHIGEEFLIELF